MLEKMSVFESKLKELTSQLSKFSLVEFYHDEAKIKSSITKLGTGLEEFSLYLPTSKLTVPDMDLLKQTIKVELRERFKSFI